MKNYLIILVLFLFSCTNKNKTKNTNEDKTTISKFDSIDISNSLIKNFDNICFGYRQDKRMLMLNRDTLGMSYFYDLDLKKREVIYSNFDSKYSKRVYKFFNVSNEQLFIDSLSALIFKIHDFCELNQIVSFDCGVVEACCYVNYKKLDYRYYLVNEKEKREKINYCNYIEQNFLKLDSNFYCQKNSPPKKRNNIQ